MTVIVILLQKRGDWQRLGSCADLLKDNMNNGFLKRNCLGNVLLIHNHCIGRGGFGGRSTTHLLGEEEESITIYECGILLMSREHQDYNEIMGQACWQKLDCRRLVD